MYVYFMKAESDPVSVKIGKARDPQNRLGDLQTGSVIPLSIIGAVECANDCQAMELERKLHNRLEAFRIRGEWFSWTAEAQAVVYEILGTKGPKIKVTQRGTTMSEQQAELLTIEDAATKYEIDVKRLRGAIWTNRLADPIGDLETGMVYDDWRLRRLSQTLSLGVRG